ncbi:MAG: calcium-binding protein [Okeania sp. SIO2D1]|nr:calcium-binding protein [Okeania sp. SIO2D1]
MAVINGNSGNNFLTGTPSNDQIYGFDGSDTLEGNGGNDLLSGGRHQDSLRGGSHSDTLYGGKGNDVLRGDSGNDTLYGDRGIDLLNGGSGTNVLYGGSDADLFIPGTGSTPDFNSSEGDQFFNPPLSFSASTFSEEPSISSFSFIELKQQGEDLLVRNSSDEEYFTFVGHGEYINDPTPFLSSFVFIEPSSIDSFFNSDDLGNYEENFQAEEDGSEAETDSEITDPLTGLREAEANLIQQIEHLEAGGALSELGVQGPALETVTTTDLQGALSEIQGYISDELARQEEAAVADNFLLPEVLEPGKQVFVMEEGTTIPLHLQEEMMGGEILFMPSEFFEVTTLEDVLTSMGFFEPEGLF